ncbi:hypothetical protein ACYCCF_09970 [Streptomyces argenteolus]|uniref:hypothetical protein n=1 Tax=Streptomyces sp. NPDC025273 TaxID=3155251 RepID=UPI0033F2089F
MNVFHGGGGLHLEGTNGGTSVFVDVLILTVSALADEPWDFQGFAGGEAAIVSGA